MATGALQALQRESDKSEITPSRIAAWAPYIIALFFALAALRGVNRTDVVDTDAARHAMNGAFVYDMLRTGHLRHPGWYAMEYYGHLPALSMPYHPPVFPLIESAFFALLGVKLLAARLAVALAAGISAVLLYRLILATSKSHALAACATITTFSLATVQLVARDVMLEFPAMAFTLAALHCLLGMERGLSMRRALLFALFASIAVWTKQHAIFIGAMPVAYALASGRPRLLLAKPVWVATLIFATSVLGLLVLSLHFNGVGLDQAGITSHGNYWLAGSRLNLQRYSKWIAANSAGLPRIFVVCSLVAYLWGIYRRGHRQLYLTFYLVWIVLDAAVLLVSVGSIRYMFSILPPVIVVGYSILFRGCACVWGKRRAWYLPAGFAAAWFVAGLMRPPEFLRGPGEAAAAVVHAGAKRVLYAGEADGNFVFAVRSLDPNFRTSVIPGEKLPPASFDPAALEQFCGQYGVDWIVVEDGPRVHKWSGIGAASMRLDRSIPLESSYNRWSSGQLRIYRFTARSENRQQVLDLKVPKIRRSIEVRF